MKIVCITPTYKTNQSYLEKCIESIKNQSVPTEHYIVSDGVNDLSFLDSTTKVFNLPETHSDYGDTPRFIGTVSAFRNGADVVFWLDDDNWVLPNHVENMISDISESYPIATCNRNIYTLDEQLMGLCTETNPNQFVDTNCYMVHKSVKSICNVWWEMPEDQHIFGDRLFYKTIRKNDIPMVFHNTPTVCYRTNFDFHYKHFNFPVPELAKPGVGIQYQQSKKS